MSIGEWMDNEVVVYIYTIEYYWAIKQWGNHTICNKMDRPESIMLSEIRQTKTNTIWSNLYVNLKNHTPQNETHRKRDQTCGYQKWRVGWGETGGR